MSYAITGALAVLAGVSLVMAVLGLRVFLKLFFRGPAAAEEALERGDSIGAWWSARPMATTMDGPRDTERLAFAGRRSAAHGEVLVEERASLPRFAH